MIFAGKFIVSPFKVWKKYNLIKGENIRYNEESSLMGLKVYLHQPLEKSLIKKRNRCIKDKIESFDD